VKNELKQRARRRLVRPSPRTTIHLNPSRWKYPRQTLALVLSLCFFSACARFPEIEQEEPAGCWPCENLPEKWYWDADEDGEPDFEVTCWSFTSLMVGSSPSSYTMSIRSIYEDQISHSTNLLYPLEQEQWINANTEWNKYSEVVLGSAKCGEFEWWEGPFTDPKGDLFAFRIEGPDQNRVGVARFQLSECDGYIDILTLRIESELYGILVDE
jgi:hypothetical protein